jgi:hypothetical protein
MAGQSIAGQELVGSKETSRCRTLHQCDRKVASNAVTSQHNPRVWRLHGDPLVPRVGAMQRAVVLDQKFLCNDAGRLELGIDPVQLS